MRQFPRQFRLRSNLIGFRSSLKGQCAGKRIAGAATGFRVSRRALGSWQMTVTKPNALADAAGMLVIAKQPPEICCWLVSIRRRPRAGVAVNWGFSSGGAGRMGGVVQKRKHKRPLNVVLHY